MKMLKFMAIAMAATAMFASCSKEDNSGPDTGKTLVIQLPENTIPATRATSTPITGGSTVLTTLNDVTVFLLNGNSVVGAPVAFTSTDISNKFIEIQNVAGSVNGVLVLANIPSADQSAVLAYTSSTAIKNHAYSVTDQNATADIQGKLLMGTSAKTSWTLAPSNPNPGDPDDYYTTSVTLDAVTARFEIGTLTAGTGIASIQVEGVWINNYFDTPSAAAVTFNSSGSTFWATSPATSTSPSAASMASPTITNAYTPAAYYTLGNSAVNGTSLVYSFQLFSGAYVPHVIFLVSGEYATGHHDGTNKYFLGWLTYDKFYDASIPGNIPSVESNMIYKVGLGGITVTAPSVTPTPETAQFDLRVDVTVTPWTDKAVVPGLQ